MSASDTADVLLAPAPTPEPATPAPEPPKWTTEGGLPHYDPFGTDLHWRRPIKLTPGTELTPFLNRYGLPMAWGIAWGPEV